MELRNFIDGKFIDSISKKNIPVLNPANQKIVGNIDEALDEEIDLAFQAAKRAFDKRILVDMDSKEKSNMMRAIAQKLRERKDEGGKLLSQENGKTIKQCVDEFKGAADTFDFYAGLTDKIENKLIPSGNDTLNYVVLEPFGVALQIVPWNYPVSLFSGMVAQNWIVGNTIVIKPPELCLFLQIFMVKYLKRLVSLKELLILFMVMVKPLEESLFNIQVVTILFSLDLQRLHQKF